MSSASRLARYAIDTSVAVPYLDAGHAAHTLCVEALAGREAVVSGHAAFASFAVSTNGTVSNGPTISLPPTHTELPSAR